MAVAAAAAIGAACPRAGKRRRRRTYRKGTGRARRWTCSSSCTPAWSRPRYSACKAPSRRGRVGAPQCAPAWTRASCCRRARAPRCRRARAPRCRRARHRHAQVAGRRRADPRGSSPCSCSPCRGVASSAAAQRHVAFGADRRKCVRGTIGCTSGARGEEASTSAAALPATIQTRPARARGRRSSKAIAPSASSRGTQCMHASKTDDGVTAERRVEKKRRPRRPNPAFPVGAPGLLFP